MNILKEILLNQLIKIPAVKTIAKRNHQTGLGSNKELIEKAFAELSDSISLKGKKLLELGAGQTLDIILLSRKHGAKSVTIADVEKYLDDEKIFENEIEYVIYDGKTLPLPDSSFDVIWSNDVYEHIRFPEITVKETHRLLKKGGLAVHIIDLGDHFSYGIDAPELSFNCLKYSETIWNLMTWNRSNYVNRLRASDWVKLHESVGFTILSQKTQANEYIQSHYLTDDSLSYLRKFSKTDAVSSQIHLVAKK